MLYLVISRQVIHHESNKFKCSLICVKDTFPDMLVFVYNLSGNH